MQSVQELGKTLTTIIWVASALHAAINNGQYPSVVHMPNPPTVTRRLIPKKGSEEFRVEGESRLVPAENYVKLISDDAGNSPD